MKTIGVIPARMESSRFFGKPLAPILGRPMIEHVYKRANLFKGFDYLVVATCNEEIKEFCEKKDIPVVMTKNTHERCFDRVHEAIHNIDLDVKDDDIVVVVQGDEPMLVPKMIEDVIKPFQDTLEVKATVLGMKIVSEEQFKNINIVKIVHDLKNQALYFSRAPVPFYKKFDEKSDAKRIYGIFGFQWEALKLFSSLPSTPLEIVESCDSNRLCDHQVVQKIVPYPYQDSFAVDNKEDIETVESHLKNDPLCSQY